jgi:hypothetical protein
MSCRVSVVTVTGLQRAGAAGPGNRDDLKFRQRQKNGFGVTVTASWPQHEVA